MAGDGAIKQDHVPLLQPSVQGTLLLIVAISFGTIFYLSFVNRFTSHPTPNGAEQGIRFQLDLNDAAVHELSLLPNIGPTLAERIIRDREQNGPFDSVSALDRVPGIGQKTVQGLLSYCIVDPESPVMVSPPNPADSQQPVLSPIVGNGFPR